MIYLVYIIIGIVAGLVIGVLGTGSSLVILPILSIIFFHLFPATIALKLVLGTSMATISIGAISAGISYFRRGLVHIKLFWLIVSAFIIGATIGPWIVHLLPIKILHWYVGGIIFVLGIYSFLKSKNNAPSNKNYNAMLVFIVGLLASILSSAAGIASGIIMIPFLSRYSDHRSVTATCVSAAGIYAVIGGISYIITGLYATGLPHGSLGYVYLPAFIVLAITSFLVAPLGVKLAHKLSVPLLKKLFCIYLLVAGTYILLRPFI